MRQSKCDSLSELGRSFLFPHAALGADRAHIRRPWGARAGAGLCCLSAVSLAGPTALSLAVGWSVPAELGVSLGPPEHPANLCSRGARPSSLSARLRSGLGHRTPRLVAEGPPQVWPLISAAPRPTVSSRPQAFSASASRSDSWCGKSPSLNPSTFKQLF